MKLLIFQLLCSSSSYSIQLDENLPDTLKTPLKNKAFDQFIGRPPANMVWAVDISNANLATITNMFTNQDLDKLENKNTQEIIDLEESRRFRISPYNEPRTTYSIQNRLMTISRMVMHITECVYKDSNFNSSSMGHEYESQTKLEYLVDERKCNGTPAYDLIAAAVLLSDCLVSIESCKQVVSTL